LSISIVKEKSLSNEQLIDIRALFDQSNGHDNTNYVFDEVSDFKKDGDINNFLLYEEETLLSYITVFAPKTTEAELIAITKPEQRRKGYLKSLLSELILELNRRKIYSILFVCDYRARDGISSIRKLNAKYEYSEYLLTYADGQSKRNIKNNKICIAKASPDDAADLLSINMNAFHDDEGEATGFLEENFKNPRRNLFSILYDDKIVGMVGVYTEIERHYIYGFCVDRKFQGRGIGKYSLAYIVSKCRNENNEKEISLEVQTENKNALGLYKAVGFKLVTEFKYYRKDIKLAHG
jgi:ribosomal protein S18 acetylase RimI-like enzyme